MARFVENITDNGSTGALTPTSNTFTLVGAGDWDSGSAQLEMSPDQGTTWIAVPSITLTANGYKDVSLNASEPLQYRVTLTSIAGAAADLYFWLK